MADIYLKREDIVAGLTRLGELAHEDDRSIEIAVYGGSALILAYDIRRATADVDAVARHDAAYVRHLAAIVARERRWPEDWLNDGVKGFISRAEELLPLAFPHEAPGIRMYVPSPGYLLAMKCMAMRLGEEGSADEQDIKALMRITGCTTAEGLKNLVEGYYAGKIIPARVAFGIEQIAQDYSDEHDSQPNHAP